MFGAVRVGLSSSGLPGGAVRVGWDHLVITGTLNARGGGRRRGTLRNSEGNPSGDGDRGSRTATFAPVFRALDRKRAVRLMESEDFADTPEFAHTPDTVGSESWNGKRKRHQS